MATKKVNLIISLKDGVSNKLRKIGSGLKKLRGGFSALAKGAVMATTAIVAGLGAVAKAYAEQESVNNKMKATFDSAGESGLRAVAIWGAWATSIQRVTTLGDEEIMNLVTLAKTMGVTNDKLKEATTGAIGLSKAFGIDMTASMKMVALAQQGEYEMLARYIPALRGASTEAEKHAIVQEAMARGFKVAQEELHTISGEWKALKGVVGDAMQEIGRAIFGGGGLEKGLKRVKDAIIELTESGDITYYAKSMSDSFGAMKPIIDGIADGINLVITGWKELFNLLNTVGAFMGAFAGNMQAGMNVGDALSDAKNYASDYQYQQDEKKRRFQEDLAEQKAIQDKELKEAQAEEERIAKETADTVEKVEQDKTASVQKESEKRVEIAKEEGEAVQEAEKPSGDTVKYNITDKIKAFYEERRKSGSMDLTGGSSIAPGDLQREGLTGEGTSFADFMAGGAKGGDVTTGNYKFPFDAVTSLEGGDATSGVLDTVSGMAGDASGIAQENPMEKIEKILQKTFDMQDKRMGGVK